MASTFKKQVFVSGKGVVEPYVYINRPDFGSGSFKTDRGRYKVNLTLPEDDPKCIQMIKTIEGIHKEHFDGILQDFKDNPPPVQRGKKRAAPLEGDMPFTINGDGTVTFKFSSYDSYVNRKTGEKVMLKLPVADSSGRRINNVPNIGAGSEIKVKYSVIPYPGSGTIGASVKLQLEAVMLIKLVEFGANREEDWGDEVEEGGYQVGEDDKDTVPFEEDDDYQACEDEGDF